jgi:hypothetical protein
LDDGDGLVTVLADEWWASLPALLAGRVFTLWYRVVSSLAGPQARRRSANAIDFDRWRIDTVRRGTHGVCR